MLKGIFRLAVERGLLAAAPTRRIRCARVAKTRWPSLDREHFSFLLDVLNRSEKREARALALLLLTGAQERDPHRPLGKPFPGRKPAARAAVKIFRSIPRQAGSPWIFPGRDKAKPISDIFLFWKELRAELGLGDLSIRDLRYVFADWQLRSGMSMPMLQRCIGITDMRELNSRLLCSGGAWAGPCLSAAGAPRRNPCACCSAPACVC